MQPPRPPASRPPAGRPRAQAPLVRPRAGLVVREGRRLLAFEGDHALQRRQDMRPVVARARFGPGAVQQHEQRASGGQGARAVGPLAHHAVWRRVVLRKHQHRLPLRVSQQGGQAGVGGGAGPTKGEGVRHHVGHQPPGVAGLERLGVGHQQADAGPRGHLGPPGTQAVAGWQAASAAARAAGPAAGEERLGAAGQALGTQASDGMWHGLGLGKVPPGQRRCGIVAPGAGVATGVADVTWPDACGMVLGPRAAAHR